MMRDVPSPRAPELPGPRSRAIGGVEGRLLSPGAQQIATLAGVAMERGEGAMLWDVDGNSYLDFTASICIASIGYGHPKYAAAIAEQAARLHCGAFATQARADLLALVAELAPPGLDRLQLFSGGAETVEAALRLARSVTGRHEVVSFWGGFHGKTGGVLGLLGSRFKHGLGPLAPGLFLAPYPDPYRPPPGFAHDDLAEACADFLDRKIELESSGRLAAILVEPVQGTAGNVFPPAGFLPRIRKVADKWGALLIVDEILTGFGRTGRMFAHERDPVAIDAMTIGKGFGGGFPVTGLLVGEEQARALPFGLPSGNSSSYGGNPLACAAALAAVRIILEEALVENARAMGARLLAALRPFAERYSFVGLVEGEGLLIRLELVADRAAKQPLGSDICGEIFQACLRRGLLTMAYNASVRINPPLVIDAEGVDRGAAILADVFDEIEDRYFAGRHA